IISSRLFFFFSSRRRHTRSDRDWSSDVCSSDLRITHFIESKGLPASRVLMFTYTNKAASNMSQRVRGKLSLQADLCSGTFHSLRSEERRVGKECRAWSEPLKQNQKYLLLR